MTIYHALVIVAAGAFLLGFGAGWHALWLVASTIQQLRQELQKTREQLHFQRLWNANLEDAVTVLQGQVREQAGGRHYEA